MQKTKLGISVGLLGAIAYFVGIFSGYTPAIIVFGYIMLVEDNPWLRKTAVKSIVLLVTFSILSEFIDFIPQIIYFVDSIFTVFGSSFSISVVTNIIGVLESALVIVEPIVFIVLGLKALSQGTIKVPLVDDIVDKTVINQ